jgi:predicted AAA+ superfamily ATPase
MSEVAREALMGRRMVENYFCALEDLLIGVRLPIFSKKAKRKLISHCKFYFFDTGVYRAIRPLGPFDQLGFVGGVALESLFFQNLRAINDYLNLNYTLFYYRTVAGVEVDFIAYGQKGLKAFEVKSKKNIFPNDLIGLKTFIKDYPMAKGYLIYGGGERRYLDKIEIIPATEALMSLPELLA